LSVKSGTLNTSVLFEGWLELDVLAVYLKPNREVRYIFLQSDNTVSIF